jgi:hypothetical protein
MKQKYYVRVAQTDAEALERYMITNGYVFVRISTDFGPQGSSSMYSVRMDSIDELSLRLSFPVLGCMNFVKTLDHLRHTC